MSNCLINHAICYGVLIVVSTLVGSNAWSADTKSDDIPHWAIFETAGKRYGIDPILLASVAKVESNYDQAATNTNKNGSVDVGVMQINSKFWALPLEEIGISWKLVETSVDININVGAWILAQTFQEVGVGWLGIGAYNAGFSDRNRSYRRHYAVKVYRALRSFETERQSR